ncbi:TIGR02444 family protein [Mycolicibacterium sediminis]|uniref:TIGR02444 family protein n=1 Tax=Mycolicibacterium sediminis TaxID=1286180 RepID=UPI0013D4D130|nr:TIGR02444 family protein [Mycolicibacterium sediminis]
MSDDVGFTRFVLDLYGAPGVSSACVLLQDRCAVDVNVVLLAAFVGVHGGRVPTQAELDDAAADVKPWQDEVVVPLRRVRRRLTGGPDHPPSAALRARIKDVELEAEMIELERLGVIAEGLTAVVDSPAGTTASERVTAAIVRVLGTSDPLADEQAAVDVIARAAAALGDGASR